MTTKRRKLILTRDTLTKVAGGPAHRTTNRCTANEWQTCWTWCPPCEPDYSDNTFCAACTHVGTCLC
jgi:hypothetical protein